MKLRLRLFLTGVLAAAMAGSLDQLFAASHDAGQVGDGERVSVVFTPKQSAAAGAPGRSIYDGACSRCHGPEGQEGKAPSLVPFRWKFSQALDIVRHGGSCGMPAFTESELSDEQLQQIVDYLKTVS